MKQYDLHYLRLLSKSFPTIQEASTELINLEAILELPKGTEHFLSDIHGESKAFNHILNNCSGNLHYKLHLLFKDELDEEQIKELATLVYYPKEKLEILKNNTNNIELFYEETLTRLVKLLQNCSSKYTKSKVRKALPKDFAYILEELLYSDNTLNKIDYNHKIIQSIVNIDRADAFIIQICKVIKKLAIDHLHIVGDLFDRGPSPDEIIENLMSFHAVDIEWGNHDCLWMGACSGSPACIVTVLINAIKYNNLEFIEDGYGINLLPLFRFANKTYKVNKLYYPKVERLSYSISDFNLLAKVHKALMVLMLKLEGQIIKRHPEFDMNDRLLLDKIDVKNNLVTIANHKYQLKDTDFPTIDWNDPYTLNKDEQTIINRLIHTFRYSTKLRQHIKFLYSKGSLYRVFNNNLLFHSSIPSNDDGSFKEFHFENKTYKGKELLDYLDLKARVGFYSKIDSDEKLFGEDILWFLWCGKDAPTVGRKKIATFERLYIDDKSTHEEPKNAYYHLINNENYVNAIFKEFELDINNTPHIINGHIPVKRDESPIKCNGKVIVIDGGFCKAYHKTTGIAGYTMFYNSWGIRLAAHQEFTTLEDAIYNNRDIISTTVVYSTNDKRIKVKDSDVGKELQKQIDELKDLLYCYRNGLIKEKTK